MNWERVCTFTEVHFELNRELNPIATGTDVWTVSKCKEDPDSENYTYEISKETKPWKEE